jgi:hypothetical protein
LDVNASELAKLVDRPAERWTPEALHEIFLTHGCAVVRGAISAECLEQSRIAVDGAYGRKADRLHVYETDIAEGTNGALNGFELVETPLLQRFLGLVFRNQSYRRQGVSARRISGAPSNAGWQEPLQLHLDSQVHPLEFTVNFWIPFQECGIDAPGLQLLPVSHLTTRQYSGYTGTRLREGDEWNMGYFSLGIFDMDSIKRVFGQDAFLHPAMAPGDVVVSSNWIIHSSYATRNMTKGRTSVEVRFIGSKLDPAPPTFMSRVRESLVSLKRAVRMSEAKSISGTGVG